MVDFRCQLQQSAILGQGSVALNGTKLFSKVCSLCISNNSNSASWIASGIRGPPSRHSRLARQLAINLKTHADTRISLVQLDQLTGLSFQIGSLETGTETRHCGCELRKVFLASVFASNPSSIFVRGQSLSAFRRNVGPLHQRWLSSKLRALNTREQTSAELCLQRMVEIVFPYHGSSTKHLYCLTRNVCWLSECSGLLWLTSLGSNRELLPSIPVVVYSWALKVQLSSSTQWLRHRNSPGRIHISGSSLLHRLRFFGVCKVVDGTRFLLLTNSQVPWNFDSLQVLQL